MSRSYLASQFSDPARTADISAMVEEWIRILAITAADAVIPKVHTILEAGKVFEVPRQPYPMLPGESAVWVHHLEGSGQFLGNTQIPSINGDSFGYLPSHHPC